MQRYVIGNWKCHKTTEEACRWFDEFAALYRPVAGLSVVVAPPVVCLERLSAHLRGLGLDRVFLAVQDISPFPKGAYTGAVAADMIKGMAGFVIVGHSDRRRYFHETDQDILNKVQETADAGLIPIVCVDRPGMLDRFHLLKDIDCREMIIAYTPVDALNFRIPESPEAVTAAAAEIARIHPRRPVVYGGSIGSDIAGKYAGVSGLSGLFVGAASLDAGSFAAICKNFS